MRLDVVSWLRGSGPVLHLFAQPFGFVWVGYSVCAMLGPYPDRIVGAENFPDVRVS